MEKDTKKCLCDEPQCAKCLSVNCQNKECLIHTKEAKKLWQKNWESRNKKKWAGSQNY